MKVSLKLFVPLALLAVLSSCIPQKKLKYLQDPVETRKTFPKPSHGEQLIKPSDDLYIDVSSFDEVNYNFFNTGAGAGGLQTNTELSVSLSSFRVKEDGTIFFPVIGQVKVEGLTLEQTREKLTEQLKPYFDRPTVTVKFAYKKVSVLGEVNNPGYFTYSKEEFTIYEALSMAGDLTVHGDRREIYLLRDQDDNVEKIRVDLTSDNVIESDYYYIRANDVIYIPPRKSLKWNIVSVPYSLILSTLTSGLLIVTYIETIGNNNQP